MDIKKINPPEQAKKYEKTIAIVVIVTGILLCGFWYFAMGLSGIWIPAAIAILALLILHFFAAPKFEAIFREAKGEKG